MRYSKKVTLTFEGRKFVEVAEDLHIRCSAGHFVIPKGFKTDLASIPRFLWWFVSPTDWFILVPAIFHDWLYKVQIFTRKKSDGLFLEKMKDFGGGFVKRKSVHRVVRLTAWLPWKNKRKRYTQFCVRKKS